MAIATRNGEMDLHLNEYDIDTYDKSYISSVVDASGVAVISLMKDNYFFSVFPKTEGYKKILDSIEKQVKLC